MKNINYIDGMKQIASQLKMEKIISSPTVLPSAMADLWLPEKEIEIMRMVMRSSCASLLLEQIQKMGGSEQDYQKQKAMLMDKAFLGEEPAHRVLVGLWAMVGKDVEQRIDIKEKQESTSQIEKEYEENSDQEKAEQNKYIEIDRERNKESDIKKQEHCEQGKKKSSVIVWGLIIAIAALGLFFYMNGSSMAAYRDVMLGKKTFISGDTGVEATVYETYKCFEQDARRGYPQEFVVADVDRDGKDEVVIGLSEDQYRLVLDKQGARVYGYIFGFRAMKCIYTDGSFEWSSSSEDSGFAYAHFDRMSYSLDKYKTDVLNKIEMKFHPYTESTVELYFDLIEE